MDAQNGKLLKIGLLSNIFEWYEYSIFGFLASMMGQLFLESSQPIVGLINGFMLFAMSYIIRPVGSLFFGLMRDRAGGSLTLQLSLILMSVPTVLIGLLPTYDQAGIFATLSLCMLRLIQGFAAGGELPSSALYIFETASSQRKSLLCSAVMASSPIGMLLGSLVATVLFRCFDQATLFSWAWRIPFWLGIPLTLFIVTIRRALYTAPSVTKTRRTTTIWPPISWDSFGKPFFKATCLVSFQTICVYAFFIWMPSYLQYFLEVPADNAYFTHTLALFLVFPFYPLVGYCAQCWGYSLPISIGTLAIVLLIIPLFKGLQLSAPWESLLAFQLILLVLSVAMNSVFIEMLAGFFPSDTRNLGVSLAFSLPPSFIGSTTPLVCSYMIHKTGWLLFPAFYIMFFGLLALPVALRLKAPSKSPT